MRDRGADAAELEALYTERFRAFVFSMTALLGDGEAALEVVQEAFALALRRRHTFRAEGSLEAWVWRIVLNKARDRRRTRGREAVAAEVDAAAGEAPAADDDVRESLRTLPERQRLAVFLRHYADLTYEQIGEALGVSGGTVAASLNAAYATLRRRLEEVPR